MHPTPEEGSRVGSESMVLVFMEVSVIDDYVNIR